MMKILKWHRASYSWVSQDDIQDFIECFEMHASQSQNPKRRKVDLETKIQLALNAIPGFCPSGWPKEAINPKSGPARTSQEPNVDLDEPCVVCRSLEEDDKCLICDSCSMNLHFFCIGLSSIPDGAWICPWCEQGFVLNTKQVFSFGAKRPEPKLHAHTHHHFWDKS